MEQSIKKHLLDSFEKEELEEIANGSLIGGVGGFTYYNETVQFHDEHEEEIWNMLDETANEQDLTILNLISSFNNSHVGSITQLKNLLTWFAVEETARKIVGYWE
jgi:hypothetical protein|tara:strand:- start:42 stop:356 length:315 start_codon:yes stop_codon:yes gene_type:complete